MSSIKLYLLLIIRNIMYACQWNDSRMWYDIIRIRCQKHDYAETFGDAREEAQIERRMDGGRNAAAESDVKSL